MWELDHKESQVPKNLCFWIAVLEKTLESPLDCKEIQPVKTKGNQPWIFTGRTEAEAEAPILWSPHAELTHWKRPWCWERLRAEGVTEDEMTGWHHWLNGHEFEQTLGDGEGQGSLVCCSGWGHKESRHWTMMTTLKPLGCDPMVDGSLFHRHPVTNSYWALGLDQLVGEAMSQGFFLSSLSLVDAWYPCPESPCWSKPPVQSLSHVRLLVTPWTAAHQTSVCITNSQSLLKLMSIELMMSSNHLILCHPPSPPAFNLSQYQGLFQWVSSSHQVAKVLEFQLQHQSSNEYSGLISFRMDQFDLLAVPGTLKSLLQHHSSKAQFFSTQFSL